LFSLVGTCFIGGAGAGTGAVGLSLQSFTPRCYVKGFSLASLTRSEAKRKLIPFLFAMIKTRAGITFVFSAK
jgi:hypothetical protein